MHFPRFSMNKVSLIISISLISTPILSSEYETEGAASTIIEDFSSSGSEYDDSSDFSGHRIGMGVANASYVDANIFVFEYGYEFNRYIGFMLSGSSYDDTYQIEIEDTITTFRNDGTYTRVATDIGYTFDLTGFDIKPYVSAGILYLSETNGLKNSSETKFQYGAGVRATLDMGVYLDAAYKVAELDNWIDSTSEREGNEVTLTIGYKF